MDEHIGDEEQNEKQKKEQNEINRERVPYPITPDHLVASFEPLGSYSGPILTHPYVK